MKFSAKPNSKMFKNIAIQALSHDEESAQTLLYLLQNQSFFTATLHLASLHYLDLSIRILLYKILLKSKFEK
jgi:hypothetical protein